MGIRLTEEWHHTWSILDRGCSSNHDSWIISWQVINSDITEPSCPHYLFWSFARLYAPSFIISELSIFYPVFDLSLSSRSRRFSVACRLLIGVCGSYSETVSMWNTPDDHSRVYPSVMASLLMTCQLMIPYLGVSNHFCGKLIYSRPILRRFNVKHMFASGPSNQSFTFTVDGRTLIAFDHCFVIVPYVKTFQSRTPRKDYGMGWLQLLKYACCSLVKIPLFRCD